MGTPEGWPDRPAFGRFRIVTVEKPDRRRIQYYDWPGETDGGDPSDGDPAGADAIPQSRPDDGV